MRIEPYLYFDGHCEEAIEFYKTSLGAQVDTLMRFKEAPGHSIGPAGSGDKVMHAAFRIDGVRWPMPGQAGLPRF